MLHFWVLLDFAVLVLFVPGIKFAEFFAHLLKLVRRFALAACVEVRAAAALVLGDPLGSERAVLDLGEHLLHLLLGLVGDETLTRLIVAELCRIEWSSASS